MKHYTVSRAVVRRNTNGRRIIETKEGRMNILATERPRDISTFVSGHMAVGVLFRSRSLFILFARTKGKEKDFKVTFERRAPTIRESVVLQTIASGLIQIQNRDPDPDEGEHKGVGSILNRIEIE
ncbi:hypothetical protein KQX54_011766 [Cotesia glomerata]|uniref:Uncharacterized protein n=1 Tax=Cotesia glomerata TaxID=32391 RepID=A0AAV7IXH2_COTGL|nr:hypothetical protein KQX54_011766 [Cotesia glomerata]